MGGFVYDVLMMILVSFVVLFSFFATQHQLVEITRRLLRVAWKKAQKETSTQALKGCHSMQLAQPSLACHELKGNHFEKEMKDGEGAGGSAQREQD